MAANKDTLNRKMGSDQEHMAHNHQVALAQGEKTAFRVHKVALSADKYNPAILTNVIQQKMIDN